MRLRIGTRGSPLALAQSGWVARTLEAAVPGLKTELVAIRTTGDQLKDRPLSSAGGKGLFVKEIEEALLAGQVDCAVHSMKDLPAKLADGLIVAAVPMRGEPCDVVLTRGGGLGALAAGATVGTSSLRRTALIRAARPDLRVSVLRGNVDTRVRKLVAGEVDAVLLAAAGLYRLGLQHPFVERLDPETFVPAIGQGALAVETRNDGIAALVHRIEDAESRIATDAERGFLHGVGGSCVTPLAAYATVAGGEVFLRALIAHPDGKPIVRGERRGAAVDAGAIGRALAHELLDRGGREILQAIA